MTPSIGPKAEPLKTALAKSEPDPASTGIQELQIRVLLVKTLLMHYEQYDNDIACSLIWKC